MTKELIQAYTARVTQASKTELVVIVYEIILTDIAEAQKEYQTGNIAEYVTLLKHAQRFLNELMGTLDYRHEISYQLMSLYIFINKALITAMFQKTPETLQSVDSVIRKLMEGFQGISKEDISGPVMKNVQQLYAGLTYGKGVLNEVYIDPMEHKRGFKA